MDPKGAERDLPEVCRFCGCWGKVSKLVNHLRELLSEKEKAGEECLSKLRWLKAEFENYQKRSAKEKEELIELANQELILKLLDVLDNFERALESAKKGGDRGSVIQGIEMIHQQLLKTLEEEGLSPIEALGKPFDPFKHEAVEKVESQEHEDGTIVGEIQRGYQFKSRVLRPSKVKVVKNPSPK